jgi:peroxiredoxin Q/BCP
MLLLVMSCNQASPRSDSLNINVGDQAPDFTLPAFPAHEFSLSDQRDRNIVVLYFYPADATPNCAKQACAFRDTYSEYVKRGAVIYGISKDDVYSHQLFADEYDIPFPLLYDQNGKIRRLFGEPDGSIKLSRRITYVIDKDGTVHEIIRLDDDADWAPHVERSLAAVMELSGESTS